MSSVTLDHVHKKFGNAKGVEDVHIHIESGEFFTFLGPSGCGKTTTLRMIAWLLLPDSRANPLRFPGGYLRSAPQAQYRHGVPKLCAFPAHDRF